MKKCSRCGEIKKMDDFYRMAAKKDGRRPECIICHNKRRKRYERDNPIKHRCNVMGRGIITRTTTGRDRPVNRCYKENNVVSKIGSTGSEVAKYLYENYYDEVKALEESGKVATVDRIDPTGDYEPSNIRIASHEKNSKSGLENARRATSKPITAEDLDGNKSHFESISEASRELNIKRDTIIRNRDRGTRSRAGYFFYEP